MKIIIFIGLKIVEILAIVFIPYYVGKFAKLFINEDDTPNWLVGIFVLVCGALLVFVVALFVAENWEWAGKLIEK